MKTIWHTLTAVLIASFVISCKEHSPSTNIVAPVQKKFKVGLILPLTGPVADYGQAITNSVNLAISDDPQAFENLELIYEDPQYDTAKAVAAFHKLVNQDKVNLVYTFGIAFCQALAPLAESYKMPTILQCIDPNSAKGRKYSMRFMNYTDQYLQLQNEYLQAQGVKKIGIVITDNAYLEEMYKALERTKFPDQEIKIIDRFTPSENSFLTTITKAKSAQYDAIGVFLSAGQLSQFFKEARSLQLNTVLFGTNFFESLSEIVASNGAMDNAIFVNNIVRPEFVANYKAKYGNEGQLTFGSLAYEALRLIAKNVAKLPDPQQKIDDISSLLSSEGHKWLATNPGVFEDTPEVGKFYNFPLAVKQVKVDSEGNITFNILQSQ